MIEDYSTDLRVQRKSPRTISFYQRNLRLFGRWLKSKGYQCVLGDVNLRTVKLYILYLQEERCRFADHPRIQRQNTRLSPRSVQCSVRSLKALSSWLYREEYASENRLARLRLPKAPRVEIKILTDEEISSIFKAIDPDISSGARDYAIILVMLDSGLRMSEVICLNLMQVDLEHNRLWVNGKGSKERLVPFGVRCQRYLRRYITHFRPQPLRPDIQNAFLNIDGTPLTEQSMREIFRRFARKCSIPRLHAHLCRHTFGTNYLKNGGDVFSLQKILGHEDLSTVKMYMHLADSDVVQKHSLYSPMDRIDLSDRGVRRLGPARGNKDERLAVRSG